MSMAGRNYQQGISEYRYGFNGKEKDKLISADSYDFGARIYDGRLGRWLSVDALQNKYPNLTPYHFAGNNPTASVDIDGKDTIRFVTTTTIYQPITCPSGMKIGGTAFTNSKVLIKPAGGKDVFYVDVVNTNMSAHGATTSTMTTKEFFPNAGLFEVGGPMRGTGITKSTGALPFMERDDEDGTTLAKIAPKELVAYLEKHNPNLYGSLRLDQAGLKIGNAVAGIAGGVLLIEEGISGLASLGKAEGIIYERIDKSGNIEKPYVGQTKSEERFIERQKEHARANPNSDFEFKIIDRGNKGPDLNLKEQKALDARGGPTNKSNPNGGTSNKKNVIKKTG
jgi:RHS repeat-associated protein